MTDCDYDTNWPTTCALGAEPKALTFDELSEIVAKLDAEFPMPDPEKAAQLLAKAWMAHQDGDLSDEQFAECNAALGPIAWKARRPLRILPLELLPPKEPHKPFYTWRCMRLPIGPTIP